MADIDLDLLVNDSTGTQIKDAFKAVGIELPNLPGPGVSTPGVYNGVQIVDAFIAYNKAHPGVIDMSTILVGMCGTQVVDAFKLMIAAVKPAVVIPAAGTGTGTTPPSSADDDEADYEPEA